MLKKIKFTMFFLAVINLIGIYNGTSLAEVGDIKENLSVGHISEGATDEAKLLNAGNPAYNNKAANECSFFPADGTVINLEYIGLNVRTAPWGKILGALPNSAKITVTGESGEWYQIQYKGRTAYAYKTYISLNHNKTNKISQTNAVYSNGDSEKSAVDNNNTDKKGNNITKRISDSSSNKENLKINAKNNSNANKESAANNQNSNSDGNIVTNTKNSNDITKKEIITNNNSNYESYDISQGSYPNDGEAVDKSISNTSSAAESGRALIKNTESLSRTAREEAVKKSILSGNIPSFLKKFKEIKVTKTLSDGREHTISYYAMPDYLSVGSDSDYVRTPLNPITAQQIADQFGCMLPTAKMVDDIYAQASTKLNPQPMSSGNYLNWQNRMMKSEFYIEHNKLIESQISGTSHKNGNLIAGHKKDVIISNSLNLYPKKVIIYGWQLKGGKNIQPLSWIHENTYADYSHGIRLIKKEMIVDGIKMDAAAVLKDSILSKLLSGEGPFNNIRADR